jgi:hypothetical protein
MLLSTSNTDIKDGSDGCIVCGAAMTGVVDVLLKEKRRLKPKGLRRSARGPEGSAEMLADVGSKCLSGKERRSEFVIAVADLLRVGLLAAILREV